MGGDGEAFAAAASVVASLAIMVGVTGYQGHLFRLAGAKAVGGAAAFMGLLLVGAALLAAVALYRWGFAYRAIAVPAGVGAGIAIGMAVLAAVVGTSGWLACVLSILVGVVPVLILSVWAWLLAWYSPLWWSGWETRPAPAAEPAP